MAGLAAAALLMAGAVGCGGGGRGASAAKPFEVVAWEGNHQQLFDDSIHPSSVGLSLDGESPVTDPLLTERVHAAEVVGRMRVSTVTVDTVGAKVSYTLTVQVAEPTLVPRRIADTSFELTIAQTSAAFGIVRSLDSALQGRTFIGFVRRFAGREGPVPHWHLTADTAEVAHAIKQVASLGEVAGP